VRMMFVEKELGGADVVKNFGVMGGELVEKELWCHGPLSSWHKKNFGVIMMPLDPKRTLRE
jgi:hypothetical protein